jgi:hypothetical protein
VNASVVAAPAAERARERRRARAAGGAALAVVVLGATALLLEAARSGDARALHRADCTRPDASARDLHAAAAMLCGSVLADSAVEHYRGSFRNPGMFAPLVASAIGALAGTEAALGGRLHAGARRGTYGLAAAVGAAGLGFHLHDVLRRPGGLDWLNLFYGAPLGAPAALGLAGAIGLAAERTTDLRRDAAARIAGAPLGRALCGLTAFGLAGTVGEVALLHYRGSFQNPFMWLPVTLPPVAAVLVAKAAAERTRPRRRTITRAWLRLTAVLGIAGVGFHAYGVSRAMGGWRNWRQNLLDGPPLPAPPSFCALALAGLAALRLRDRDHG